MHTALVLIDLQNDYFPGGSMELAGAEAAVARARLLLDAFRARGLPVLHVQHLSQHPGTSFFLPGTPGADIHPSVAPVGEEGVVTKHRPSSFRGTDLLARLRALKVDRLVVAGMMTHMCVDTTVRAAGDLGFACQLAQDACATRDLVFEGHTVTADQVQRAYLAALNGAFALVQPARTLAEAL